MPFWLLVSFLARSLKNIGKSESLKISVLKKFALQFSQGKN
jgi:hypothetical protein